MKPTSVALLLGIVASSCTTASLADELNAPPTVHLETARSIAKGITLIPDGRINYVPNIGIIEGRDKVLVVDTGIGPRNGLRVLELAKKIAGRRTIYLTTTHFHPEHSFGAQSFQHLATYLVNGAQAKELADKGPAYLTLFRTFGADVARELQDTKIPIPDETYDGERTLDLGGRQVILREMPAHTRGDQIVYVPDAGVVFLGDLVESRFFPIFPDEDSKGSRWIEVTARIEALKPKVVVPGHGEIGTVALVRTTHDYLRVVRDRVAAELPGKRTQAQITSSLAPVLKGLHPDWDNAVFIPYEIASFFAEETHTSLQLPDLEKDLSAP